MSSLIFGISQRERDNLIHKEKLVKINISDVLMIKGDEKNRGEWNIEIIENIFMGKDNVNRSLRIHTGKRVIERPIELLYPVELHCNSKTTTKNTQDGKTLNVNAEEFQPKRLVGWKGEGGAMWKSQGHVQFGKLFKWGIHSKLTLPVCN